MVASTVLCIYLLQLLAAGNANAKIQLISKVSGRSVFGAHARRDRKNIKQMDNDLLLQYDTPDGSHQSVTLKRAACVLSKALVITRGDIRTTVDTQTACSANYRSQQNNAVLNFMSPDLVKGVVTADDGKSYNIEIDADGGETLTELGSAFDEKHTCGNSPGDIAHVVGEDAGEKGNTNNIERRAVDPGDVEKWTNCYPGDNIKWHVDIGMAVGTRGQQKFNTEDDLIAFLQSLVVTSNYYIYERQLNLVLRIKEIYLSPSSNSPDWDDTTCRHTVDGSDYGISGALDRFKTWDPPSSEVALWHLIDDCFGFSGSTSGIANLGVVCKTEKLRYRSTFLDGTNEAYSNRGVTYITETSNTETDGTWLTFAHEIGHNFDGEHPFSDSAGQGTYGGIMDYGRDVRLNGEHQFNSAVNKDNICSHMTSVMGDSSGSGCAYINPYAAACGNGVIEDGEQCECKDGSTSCRQCTSCQFDPGAVCTPDAAGLGQGECCTSDGQFKGFGSPCGTGGYCGKGICQAHHTYCPRYKMTITYYVGGIRKSAKNLDDVCEAHVDGNDCQIGCAMSNEYASDRGVEPCLDMQDAFSAPVGNEPDGNICRINPNAEDSIYGTCSSGVCVGNSVSTTTGVTTTQVSTTRASTAVTSKVTTTTVSPGTCSDSEDATGYTDPSTGDPLTCTDFVTGSWTINDQPACQSERLRRHCQLSCGACGECFDIATGYTSNGSPVTCAEFAAGDFSITCSTPDIARRCPDACGLCRTSVGVPTTTTITTKATSLAVSTSTTTTTTTKITTTTTTTVTSIDPRHCAVTEAEVSWADSTGTPSYSTAHASFGAPSLMPQWGIPVVLETGTSPIGCDTLNVGSVSGGAVAIMRGQCTFWQKALNAQRAGAELCIIYNSEGRDPIGSMSCSDEGCAQVTIPVLFMQYDAGQALVAAAKATPSLTINVACPSQTLTTMVTTDTAKTTTSTETTIKETPATSCTKACRKKRGRRLKQLLQI